MSPNNGVWGGVGFAGGSGGVGLDGMIWLVGILVHSAAGVHDIGDVVFDSCCCMCL